MLDFFKTLIHFFEQNNISYMLSGSVAMSTYTVPRFTRDFDFIVHLKPEDALLLSTSFKDGYYCDEDSIREAIKNKSLFNIIDYKSNYKAHYRQRILNCCRRSMAWIGHIYGTGSAS